MVLGSWQGRPDQQVAPTVLRAALSCTATFVSVLEGVRSKTLIPAELTKDAAAIELPIQADLHDCHDTTLWYRPVYGIAV